MILARPDEWETGPYHFSLHLFMMVRRSSYGRIACCILAQTSSLVTWSLCENHHHESPCLSLLPSNILRYGKVELFCNQKYTHLEICIPWSYNMILRVILDLRHGDKTCVSSQRLRGLGDVRWPQILDLPKIPPPEQGRIESHVCQNVHGLPSGKST